MLISRRTKLSLRAVGLLYLTVLLLLPLGVVFGRTFEHGLGVAWGWVTTPAAVSALWLTVLVAARLLCRERQVTLRVVANHRSVLLPLRVTGVDALLDVTPTLAQATRPHGE